MKQNFLSKALQSGAVLSMLFMLQTSQAQVASNTVKLNTSDKKITINKHIYGHFAEH